MLRYESYDPETGSVYVSDENGEHTFVSEDEYKEYKKAEAAKKPIVCDTCIYHLREGYKCQMGKGECEGKCIGCTYYYPNPQSFSDWVHRWCFLMRNYYWFYRRKIEYKFKIGYYKTYRKFFFYLPTRKYPYFMFVKRVRNEFEDECNVYNIGYISKEHSYEKTRWKLFEKIYSTDYHFSNEHINYEYYECVDDCMVDMVNGIKSDKATFKCYKGRTYHVRHVEKYKYYDIVYENKDINKYEIRLIGQMPDEEFEKKFCRLVLNSELNK